MARAMVYGRNDSDGSCLSNQSEEASLFLVVRPNEDNGGFTEETGRIKQSSKFSTIRRDRVVGFRAPPQSPSASSSESAVHSMLPSPSPSPEPRTRPGSGLPSYVEGRTSRRVVSRGKGKGKGSDGI